MLAYRYGFLFHHKDETPVDGKRWGRVKSSFAQRSIDQFVFWTHSSTPVAVFQHREGKIVILGDAYSHTRVPLLERLTGLDWADPWPGLDDLGGRFAVAFLSGDAFRVANDAFGSRTVFYAPGRRMVASHAHLLGGALRLSESKKTLTFMESPEYKSRTTTYLPGDLTVFKEVFTLVPNNYWDGERTHRYWPRKSLRATTKVAFLNDFKAYLDVFKEFILERRYTPIFGITGGIDSRAGFAPFDRKLLGTSWYPQLRKEEHPVVNEIVAKLAIQYTPLRTPEFKPDRASKAGALSAGKLREPRGHVEAMAKTYGSANNVFIRGYGGEIIRGFDAYYKRKNIYSHKAMTFSYSTSMRDCPRSAEYVAFCHAAFEGYFSRANLGGIEALGYQVWDLFYWEHRMGMWAAAMLREMDPAVYSLVAFNSRPLYEAAFGLPEEDRRTKELLLDVIRMYDEELAAIPYM